MSYINQEILERYITKEELVRLTDDENTGLVNETRLQEAIEAAEGEFETYLKDLYQFPLPQLPEMLINIIADITIYNLYKRRMRLDMPDTVVSIYNEAIDKLEKIKKGFIILDIPKPQKDLTIKVNKRQSDRMFSKETLEKL